MAIVNVPTLEYNPISPSDPGFVALIPMGGANTYVADLVTGINRSDRAIKPQYLIVDNSLTKGNVAVAFGGSYNFTTLPFKRESYRIPAGLNKVSITPDADAIAVSVWVSESDLAPNAENSLEIQREAKAVKPTVYIYDSPGVYVFNPPADNSYIVARVKAAGGGGGGTFAAVVNGGGGGGGEGAEAEIIIDLTIYTGPFTLTVGTGGVGAAGATGGDGTNSSIVNIPNGVTMIDVEAGKGGSAENAANNVTGASGGDPGGIVTFGADLVWERIGQGGGAGFGVTSTNSGGLGGIGGGQGGGKAQAGQSGASAGVNGLAGNNGGGGSGAERNNGAGAALAGGNGGDGYISLMVYR